MVLKILILVLFSCVTYAKTIRVIVMDTGYYLQHNEFKACQNHELDTNFTRDTSLEDIYPHGQNINHIIARDLEKVDYCIINLKIMTRNSFDMFQYELALIHAMNLKPDIINMSFSGQSSDDLESLLIRRALNQGIKLVVAAGNNNVQLTKKNCTSYPACIDPRIITVGCLKNERGEKCDLTNYGSYIKIFKVGYRISAGGLTMTGTSQAAAAKTNELIKELAKGKK